MLGKVGAAIAPLGFGLLAIALLGAASANAVTDAAPPSLTLPAAAAPNATSSSGAIVSFIAVATDDVKPTSLLCVPASGTRFAVGATTVTCAAMDAASHSTSGSFTITVLSASEQLALLHSAVVAMGIAADVQQGLLDKLDAALTSIQGMTANTACNQLNAFAHQVNAQTGKAIADATGLIRRQNEIEAALDCVPSEAPPVLLGPQADVTTTTAPGLATATIRFTGESSTVECAPTSPAALGIGLTKATCTATNANGTTKTSFNVTVLDKEPPVITMPADITVTAPAGFSTAVVTFAPTTTDNVGIASTVCTPASGTAFAYGTTTVSCTTTDTSSNTASGTFNVTVNFAISGRITDRETATAIAGVRAAVFDTVTGNRVNFTASGSDGGYSVVVPRGTYMVLFNGNEAVSYVPQRWNGKRVDQPGDAITLDGSVGGIDAALVPGFFVHGEVTDAATHQLIGPPGVIVSAIDPALPCCHTISDVATAPDGTYHLVVPKGGTVKLQFRADPSLRYMERWWNGRRNFNEADTLTVNSETFGIDVALIPAVLLSGRVTDDRDGTGIGSVAVVITDSTTRCCPFGGITVTSTASNGTYRLLVPKGIPLKIQFVPFGSADPHFMGEWFDDQPSWDAATIETFTADTSGINAGLSRGFFISGHVARQDGTPIAGLHANANDGLAPCCQFITGSQTNASGDYRILVRPGTYKVLFFSRAPFLAADGVTYVDQWWNGAQFFNNATQIVVNADVTGINAVMTRAVLITGHVTDTSSRPVAGLHVSAQEANQPCCHFVNETQTDAAGAYRLIVPPGATVKVEFGVFGGTPPGSGLLGQWWNNQPSFEMATPISATTDIPNIDARLATGFVVSGHVSELGTGTALSGVHVQLIDAAVPCCPFRPVGHTLTNATGDYMLVVGAGTYKAQFFEFPVPAHPHMQQWWNGKPFDQGADLLVVSGDRPGIDAVLTPAVVIRGRVTDVTGTVGIPGANVSSPDATVPCCQFIQGRPTDGLGNYEYTVPLGSRVKVQFSPPPGTRYLGQWWNNKPDFATADVIDATTDQTLDARLETGFVISGTVRGPSGPVANISVGAALGGGAFCCQAVAGVNTDATGQFQIAVRSGVYRLHVNPQPSTHLRGQWWNGVPGGTVFFDQATDIVVGSSDVTGKDFTLVVGTLIQGHVSDAGTSLPIGGIGVNANDAAAPCCEPLDFAGSGPNGDYAVVVPVGSRIRISFGAGPQSRYISQWWDNKPSFETADIIDASADRTGIDARLARAVVISGRVTDLGGAVPVAGLQVNALDGSVPCCQFFGGAQTDSQGNYRIAVPPGRSVKVEFGVFNGPPPGTRYLGQWWNNKSSFETADSILAVADVSGIDAHLANGLVISGHVSETGGGALAGVHVQVIDPAVPCCPFRQIAHTQTNATGDYALVVTAGTYKVQFFEFPLPGHPHMQQWWNGKPFDQGADLLVVSGDTPAINAVLMPAVFIRGQVTDAVDGHALAGISVSAQDASVACCRFLGGAATDNVGNYSMIVPTGSTAKVEINVFRPAPGRYGGQWWNNKPTFVDADPISAAADVSGINAHLVTGFFVSGRVTDTTGHGLGGIQVVASDASLPCCVDRFTTTTSPTGDYQLLVSAGVFRIWFGDPAHHYIAQFYNNKPDPNLADHVTVTSDTPNINAALALSL